MGSQTPDEKVQTVLNFNKSVALLDKRLDAYIKGMVEQDTQCPTCNKSFTTQYDFLQHASNKRGCIKALSDTILYKMEQAASQNSYKWTGTFVRVSEGGSFEEPPPPDRPPAICFDDNSTRPKRYFGVDGWWVYWPSFYGIGPPPSHMVRYKVINNKIVEMSDDEGGPAEASRGRSPSFEILAGPAKSSEPHSKRRRSSSRRSRSGKDGRGAQRPFPPPPGLPQKQQKTPASIERRSRGPSRSPFARQRRSPVSARSWDPSEKPKQGSSSSRRCRERPKHGSSASGPCNEKSPPWRPNRSN